MENPLLNIDRTKLKSQKVTLLKVIEDCDDVPILEHLEGIVCLIDSIQDYAVSEIGIPEITVFDY